MARIKSVLPFRDKPDPHAAIASLRNLGPRSAEMLAQISIKTRKDLARRGAIAAALELQAHGHAVSLNLVYAIEGALMNTDWRCLPATFRHELKQQWQTAKRQR